ncbi:MAG: laccase domain-containing protein [Clostridia bacterium]|nr:laccase domain-containing protein [Clostridia bacterium]
MSNYIDSINNDFVINEKNGVVFYTIPQFEKLGFLKHAFSTRIGGVSCFGQKSLNMSFKRERTPGNVERNFSILADAVGFDVSDVVICHYEHGINVEIADLCHRGMGLTRDNELPFCDGLIIDRKGICAATIHADCTPIFFADKKGRAAGVCHAGWRGIYNGVFGSIIKKLDHHYGILPEDILMGLGPSIKKCCFEVKDDVAGIFLERFGNDVVIEKDGRLYVDLLTASLIQLENEGILPENVTVSHLCTYCNDELFYSYRRDNRDTGAHASVIMFR